MLIVSRSSLRLFDGSSGFPTGRNRLGREGIAALMSRKQTNRRAEQQPRFLPGQAREKSWGDECVSLLFFVGGVFLFLCLASYDPHDSSFNVVTSRLEVSNLCGLIGSHTADAMVQLIGISSLLIPIGLMQLSSLVLIGRRPSMRWSEVASLFLLTWATSVLFTRSAAWSLLKFPADAPGGTVGAFAHEALLKFLGSGGEILLCVTVILMCLLYISGISVRGAARFARSTAALTTEIAGRVSDRRKAVRAGGDEKPVEESVSDPVSPLPVFEAEPIRDEDRKVRRPEIFERERPGEEICWDDTSGGSWARLSVLPQDDCAPEDVCYASPFDEEFLESLEEFGDFGAASVSHVDESPALATDRPHAPESVSRKKPGSARQRVRTNGRTLTVREMEAAVDEYLRLQNLSRRRRARTPLVRPKKGAGGNSTAIRVEKRADEKTSGTKKKKRPRLVDRYVLPHTGLLDVPPRSNRSVDRKLLERNAVVLEQKLADLGVKGRVVGIHPGPVITMYELNLAPGIALNKVLNKSDDLAMALKSGSTRVIAPIPGKDTVGIEVPNLHREMVHFREIIESQAFIESNDPLKMALGKEIDGRPFATTLTNMPHLLIAGATGTGKSVGLNCLICSWLMSCHPDDLKLLLVDPKKLELSHYQDIPHLLHPVVTDPEKVPAVLNWAIREMERRYDLLSLAGAKSIVGYNRKVASGEIVPDPDGDPPEKLPYIVIIVDELAELMMVAAKDIEIAIARLAQMARASGIHLILATQRPSVDVVTGIIKANFPARFSFQVSAKADSRTILDTVGAEHLLGKGDMLALPPGVSKLRRLHGAYISEEEIGKIVKFIKAQRKAVYLEEISKHVSTAESKEPGADMIQEEKYDEAVELVSRLGHASISLVQRHMRIGYNRAARMIEAMEADGIVGPSDGTSRPREVLARSLAHVPDH